MSVTATTDRPRRHTSTVTAPEDGAVVRLPIELIDEHPQNTRRQYDQAKLQELADSIRERGVITPAVVRPVDGGRFQLLAGHRRRRGALLAGVTELLAVVRHLDDRAALEILTIENLQREDLHPLEEAEGFRALLDAGGYDVTTLAGKIGKSTHYVYARLQLLQLGVAVREALTRGYVPLSHAIELARLPEAVQESALQEKFRLSVAKLRAAVPGATPPTTDDEDPDADVPAASDEDDEFADDDYDGDWDGPLAGDDTDAPVAVDASGRIKVAEAPDPFASDWHKPVVPTLAELRSWLQRAHYRGLDRVPWDLTDAALVPTAGACSSCPKRSGAAPELFADLTAVKDACLDAPCYEAKHVAFVASVIAGAEAEGHTVRQISSRYHHDDRGVLTNGKFWEVVEGTAGAIVGVWIDGGKMGARTWITTTAPKPRDRAEHGAVGDDWRERSRKQAATEKKKRERLLRGREAAVAAVMAKVPADVVPAGEWGKTVFVALLDEIHSDAMHRLVKRCGLELDAREMGRALEALTAWAEKAPRVELARAFVFALLGDETTVPTYGSGMRDRESRLARFAQLVKVDVKKVAAAAEKADPTAPKQAAKKAAPKRAKKGGAKKLTKKPARARR
jgi:ParB/RepB/Spo0J family partition protein